MLILYDLNNMLHSLMCGINQHHIAMLYLKSYITRDGHLPLCQCDVIFKITFYTCVDFYRKCVMSELYEPNVCHWRHTKWCVPQKRQTFNLF